MVTDDSSQQSSIGGQCERKMDIDLDQRTISAELERWAVEFSEGRTLRPEEVTLIVQK